MTLPGRAIAGTVRRHPGPAAFVAAALVAFAALSAARADRHFWAFLLVSSGMAAVVSVVDARRPMNRRIMWMLAALGVLHLCGGLLPPVDGPTFYETWLVRGVLKFDQAVHFYGSAVATAAVWQASARRPLRARATLAATVGLALGLALEVIEHAGNGVIRAGDIENTRWDVIFDVAGVLIAAGMCARAHVLRDGAGATSTAPRTR